MCIFCDKANDRDQHIVANEHGYAINDGYPVSNGHTLIIPKRHVYSLFDLSLLEQLDLLVLVNQMKDKIEQLWEPDGYNIGINDGQVAGQTIDHTHIHLIPRYLGDVEDPRGGVRWILPKLAKYWKD